MTTQQNRSHKWEVMHKEEISTSHYIDHEKCSRCNAKRNVLYGNIPMVTWSDPDPLPRYCENGQGEGDAVE